MDKNKIYETVFQLVRESTEWGIDCKDGTYGNWIDGVITLANDLISEIENKKEKESEVNKVIPKQAFPERMVITIEE